MWLTVLIGWLEMPRLPNGARRDYSTLVAKGLPNRIRLTGSARVGSSFGVTQ
jgi:hypothetical protein